MAKTLRVIEPFLIMEIGDTFEYDSDDKMYVSQHKDEYYQNDDSTIGEIKSVYNSDFRISVEYANELVKEGYLEEAIEKTTANSFVNIFDEIDALLTKYTSQLNTIENDMLISTRDGDIQPVDSSIEKKMKKNINSYYSAAQQNRE